VRPLVLLVGAVVLVDTMFYAAITPLLPELRDELGLGKGGAGVLAAAYAAGTFAGALPGGWIAARLGVRVAVLSGLALMGVAGLAFAFGHSVVLLDGARFLQGVGGACSWSGGLAWLAAAAPRERRGEVLGTALGAAIVGGQLGPVVGAVAHAVGRQAAFSTTAVLGIALAVWAARTPAAPGGAPSAGLREAIRDRRLAAGLWLTALPSAAFGVVAVLAPLRLDALGAGALAIGATFFVAAGGEALVNPAVGRLTDRRGVRVVALPGLLAAAALLVVVPLPERVLPAAVAVVAATCVLGVLWVPSMALIASGADAVGLDQGFAAAGFSLAWAAGYTAGAAGGGALAGAASDAAPFAVVAAAALATAAAARVASRRAGPLRSPG